jgi:hypothetical chaperone protein
MTVPGMGLDFGTTNSAVAIARDDGVALAQFSHRGAPTRTFRSVLYFDPDERGRDNRPLAFTGPAAIERYLDGDCSGRLIQSIKSYLASRLFTSTNIEGHAYTLETLISKILRDLRVATEAQLGPTPPHLVVGRPVRFAGADAPADEAFALTRLGEALRQAGWPSVTFEYEPVAAAYKYESGLDHDELLLIGDFGGGTSDFCLIRVGPSVRARRQPRDILGTEGVAIAGDSFDGQIVRHLVAPRLGRGSEYVPLMGRPTPVPTWLFSHLERWHTLSFLKTKKNMQLLEDIHATSSVPEQIGAFIRLVTDDLGYHLYRAVERTKAELSHDEESRFVFGEGAVRIEARVQRSDFESWIGEQTSAIGGAVDRLLSTTGVAGRDIDAVFLTGGSSFVPAVRRLFVDRFGPARIRSGDELTSVATGLALRARDLAAA